MWSKNAWYCEVTLFQVGKQFDALLVDTSASAFDTFESDTGNVSKANLKLLLKFKAFLCRISSNTHSHKAKKEEGEPGRETGAIVHVQQIVEVKQAEQWKNTMMYESDYLFSLNMPFPLHNKLVT